MKNLAFVIILFMCFQVNGQFVSFDPEWGEDNGVTWITHSAEHARVNDIQIAPDGTILMVGGFEHDGWGDGEHAFVARMNANGIMDLSFGEDGIVSPPIYFDEDYTFNDAVMFSDSSILGLGSMKTGLSAVGYASMKVRMLASGDLDLEFGDEGLIETFTPMTSLWYEESYVVDWDSYYQTYYAFSSVWGGPTSPQVSLTGTGPAFGEDEYQYYLGYDDYDQTGFSGGWIDSEGSLYITRNLDFDDWNTNQNIRVGSIGKLKTSGIDSTFATDGFYSYPDTSTGSRYEGVFPYGDSHILVYGYLFPEEVGTPFQGLLSRYTTEGILDLDFANNGFFNFSEDCSSCLEGENYLVLGAFQRGQKILVLFRTYTSGVFINSYGMLALDSSGAIIEEFGEGGIAWLDNLLEDKTISGVMLTDEYEVLIYGHGEALQYTTQDAAYIAKLIFDFNYVPFNIPPAINSGSSYSLFEDVEDTYFAITVDSASFNNDSIFYLTPQWVALEDGYHYPNVSSYLGKELHASPNGMHRFISGLGDTLSLSFNAPVDSTWVFWQSETEYIEARVNSIEPAEVIGQNTDLSTIGLTMFDLNDEVLESPVNDWYFQYSEEFGLVSFPSLVNFPIHIQSVLDSVPQKTLVGIQNIEGVQDVNWMELNDFQVGDVLHWRDGFTQGMFLDFELDQLSSRTILSRNDFPDSLVYEVEIRELGFLYGDSVGSSVPLEDTLFINNTYQVVQTYSSSELYDTPAGIPVLTESDTDDNIYGHYTWLQQTEHGLAKVKFQGNDAFAPVESIEGAYEFTEIPGFMTYCEPGVYFEKTGGVFFFCRAGFDYRWKELLYYDNDNGEWGEPIDFTVGTSEAHLASGLTIFPNPASSSVFIQTDFPDHKLRFEIVDNLGQKHQAGMLNGGEVDVQNLKGGIYSIRVYEGDEIIGRGKFLKME